MIEEFKRIKTIYNLFSIIILILITILSLLPSSDIPKVRFINIPHFDKIVHFIMYYSLFTIIRYRLFLEKKHSLKHYIILFLLVVSYSVLMEILQFFITTDRQFDIFDIYANTFGAISGLFIFNKIKGIINSVNSILFKTKIMAKK